jgi:CBS domain-containing protein
MSAFAVSVLLLKRSVLTEKIARRGYHLSREYDVDPLEVVFVDEVVDDEVVELADTLTAAEALEAAGSAVAGDAGWMQRLYPVVDEGGALRGVVTRRGLLRAVAGEDGCTGDTRLADLARPPVAVTHGDQTLRHVAELMARHDVSRVPVVERDDPSRVVGVVALGRLLEARARDQREARERERVFRVRLLAPSRTRA